MKFQEFKESFAEDLKEHFSNLGKEVIMEQKTVEKLNGAGYDALVVMPADTLIGVTLNVNTIYQAYLDGAETNELVAGATNRIMAAFKEQPEVDVAAITDYEQMKDKLIVEIVSTEGNEELLATVPHKEMEDLSVVYRFEVDSNEESRATILVTNSLVGMMGITPEQLHEDAVKNAAVLNPVVITGMMDVIAEMMGVSREELESMGIFMEGTKDMYVASVSDKIQGAGVLAYENFMEQAAETVGGSFYVLPSSLHEVILVKDNEADVLKFLEGMVKDVNATQVAPEDKLSDNVYHYDAKEKVFELGEKFVARQMDKESAIADIEKAEEKPSVLGELKAKKEDVTKQPKKDSVEKTASKGAVAI